MKLAPLLLLLLAVTGVAAPSLFYEPRIDYVAMAAPWGNPTWSFTASAKKDLLSCVASPPLTCSVSSNSLHIGYAPPLSTLWKVSWTVSGEVKAISIDGDTQILPISIRLLHLALPALFFFTTMGIFLFVWKITKKQNIHTPDAPEKP